MAKIFDGIEKARQFLFGRQAAYKEAFDINTPRGRYLLADFMDFCFYDKSTFHADPRVQALYEGRRMVLLRVLEHLNLTPDELAKLRNV